MEGELRKLIKSYELLITILMVVALPVYGMIYLYQSSGEQNWNLPDLPDFVEELLWGAGIGLLVSQFLLFRKRIKGSQQAPEFILKMQAFSQAVKERYFLLFLVSMLSALGLLFFGSAIFNLIFAVALLFFSLGKPSPLRIQKLLKISDEEKELVELASRP
ncbi:hypothetical protein [Algoriphagus halophytocola]|uniref:MFS transporter n=1 Tax=Algoriphagus halophytocola TaxID=2991499 RepID=A0ABY6MLB7_9BACT|nr:hypothetical protein [Algoriphagus sp. TR-M5]UZD24334.1 hypothetical protein OM944_07485 [Algoriphagus sp. TR-M5]